MTSRILTPARHARYQRDGFLAIEGFVAPETCDALMARAAEIVDDFEPDAVPSIFSTRDQARTTDHYFLESGDQIRCFFEEDAFDAEGRLLREKARAINKIGHALHDRDALFDRFSRQAPIRALVAGLGVTRPLLLQSMYIFKQPEIGGEVVWHQDATFLYTEPLSVHGLWFALQDADVENGCLWALPGGHHQGLKSRFVRASDDTVRTVVLDDEPWPDDGFVPLEVPKGTLVVLHGLLPHGSRANRSGRSRQAYTLHVIDGTCLYPADNWLRRSPDRPLRGFD